MKNKSKGHFQPADRLYGAFCSGGGIRGGEEAVTRELLTQERPQLPPKKIRLQVPGGIGGENPFLLISQQPKRADEVRTRREWTALCEHLQNGNGSTHFVMGFRDANECKKNVRSKKKPVDQAISWSWTSITGSSKSRLAYVPYSTNERQQSRWGGMDFDAHDGGADRARELAFSAFRVLLNAPDICFIRIGFDTPKLASAWLGGKMVDGKLLHPQESQCIGADVSPGLRREISSGGDE